MKTIDDIIKAAAAAGLAKLAVAAAQEPSVLEAATAAFAEGIARPILVGDPGAVATAAAQAKGGRGLDISAFELVPAKDIYQAASIAVGLVRDGKADFIMKGIIDTAPLLKTVLNKETGINAGKLASHVAVIQVPTYHKLFVLSDGGLNIAPDLSCFVDIINSAVSVSKVLGVTNPKVALLAAVEKVYPDKMPCTATAALLTQMNRRGQIKGCVVDGPFGLDNAISAESARIKGIVSDVAGDADVLIVPDIEAGNILYKCLLDLAQAKGAGIVMGATRPVVLPSRADTAETKLASIALAALAGRRLG